jgi:hypothetical protein
MDKLVQEINRLELGMIHKVSGRVELANPVKLSETIAKIAIYLAQLSDEVTNAELRYKQARAAKFDRLLKDGEKRTAAVDFIRYDQELIKAESDADRLRNFIKRTENVITTIQTHIRVKNNEAAGNL